MLGMHALDQRADRPMAVAVEVCIGLDGRSENCMDSLVGDKGLREEAWADVGGDTVDDSQHEELALPDILREEILRNFLHLIYFQSVLPARITQSLGKPEAHLVLDYHSDRCD